MIQKIEIDGIHAEVTDDLKKYVTRKIGKLDKYLPRSARESAHAEVKLKEQKIKERKECTCEVILHVPGETLMTTETTMNMFAAVDIVETKLKNQLKKYKDTHNVRRIHRRVLNRVLRKS